MILHDESGQIRKIWLTMTVSMIERRLRTSRRAAARISDRRSQRPRWLREHFPARGRPGTTDPTRGQERGSGAGDRCDAFELRIGRLASVAHIDEALAATDV